VGMGEEGMMSLQFGVTEYTLVFRRAVPHTSGRRKTRPTTASAGASPTGRARRGSPGARAVWTVARPLARGMLAQMGPADRAAFRAAQSDHGARSDADGVAQVFIVPICSTLALDGIAYERFLTASGALPKALRLLSRLTFAQPQTAENARKQIQSLIMAAEVEYIVQGMSA